MSLKDEIQSAQTALGAAFSARDGVGAAALYTGDTRLMADGMASFHGREAVADFFCGAIANGIVSARFTTQEVEGDDDRALEIGRYELFAGLPNGERQCVEDGRYFIAWKKIDGAWRIHRDMFNRYKPAPQ